MKQNGFLLTANLITLIVVLFSFTLIEFNSEELNRINVGSANPETLIEDKPYSKISFAGETISYGDENAFNAADTTRIDIIKLDSTHIAVAYRDNGNSNFGTAIIGTINGGNQIDWGLEYVFNSAATDFISIDALTSTKIVIAYQDTGGTNRVETIIGNITLGNVINFGTLTHMGQTPATETSVVALSSTVFAVAKQDSIFGTTNGILVRGTVSGTSITRGSQITFNSGVTDFIDTAKIDSTHLAIVFRDRANSDYGTGIIATESGGGYTVGSEYVFNSADSIYNSSTMLDSTHLAIAYTDTGGTDDGEAIIGVIASVNQITYGSIYTFESGAATNASVDKLNSTEFILVFRDAITSDGTSIISTIANDDEISFGSDFAWTTDNTFIPVTSVIDATHFAVSFRDETGEGVGIMGILSGVVETSCDDFAFDSNWFISDECFFKDENINLGVGLLSIDCEGVLGLDNAFVSTSYPYYNFEFCLSEDNPLRRKNGGDVILTPN